MSKINKDMDKLANLMESSTHEPLEVLKSTISNLSVEDLTKAMEDMTIKENQVIKSLLEEIRLEKGENAKTMDAEYSPKKEMTRLASSGHELETGSDDEDEDLVKPKNKEHKHQGDETPEGREGQVIKGEKEEKEKKNSSHQQAAMGVRGKSDDSKPMVKSTPDMSYDFCPPIENTIEKSNDNDKDEKMEKKCGYKTKKGIVKSEAEVKEIIKSIINTLTLAGEEVTTDLVKAEMKRILKEEDQVESTNEVKDNSDAKKAPKDSANIQDDSEETADEAVAKVKKSEGEEDEKEEESEEKKESKKEEESEEKEEKVEKSEAIYKPFATYTLGRNCHVSVNAYYDECLAKAEAEEKVEETEVLEKSEKEMDINDLIEKGLDTSLCEFENSNSEYLRKSEGAGIYSSFSEEELCKSLGISVEEAKKILNN